MHLTEEYIMFKIAHNLVFEEGYDVLHINAEEQELWLEKYENKVSKVIRILHKGYDWKNHLKTDIARVFQKTKTMKKMLRGKTIVVCNIYISSHTPVDEWEDLKRPLQLNEKNPIKMKVYYFTDHNYTEELARLQTEVGTSSFEPNKLSSEKEMEDQVDQMQTEVITAFHKKQNEAKSMFSFGKPLMTYIFIVINVLMFILLELKGGSTDTDVLLQFGAKYNPAIIEGEWWRIISSMFLHIGFVHLLMNMFALYYLGIVVERIYGSVRFSIIYLLAGIGGGLTSFAFSMSISAGASGAIFGLFGALLFFGTIHKKIFLETMGRGIISVIAINILIGFAVPGIDMGAHLGGLIAGFIASALLHLPKKKNRLIQVGALFIYIAMISGLVVYGVYSTENSVAYQIIDIEEAIANKDYDSVIELTTTALKNKSEYNPELLFQRSYAYIHLNEITLAINDLEESVAIRTDYEEAYYNLTLLYSEQGEDKKAIEAVKKALRLNPDDDDYIKLYENITGESLE